MTATPEDGASGTNGGGADRTLAGTGTASVSGATVTLDGSAAPGETLTVSYARPASNPIRDLGGRRGGGLFSGQPASNVPPARTRASVHLSCYVVRGGRGIRWGCALSSRCSATWTTPGEGFCRYPQSGGLLRG